jgi:hypothetical protein
VAVAKKPVATPHWTRFDAGVWVLLEDLRDAVGHFDAGAGDEAVIVFLAEGGLCHLAPSHRRRLLTAQEHGLDTGRTAPAVFRVVQTLVTKDEISGT